jgi:aldehyde dehydrogenase (NAD+)
VVSIISPWNFPFNVPGRKVTPALIAGNTCIFKPASLTPQTGRRFVELFIEAGLPPGVLNFITGSGGILGHELVKNPTIKAVSFTGSTEVGRDIHKKAAQIMARTQLEMGGKNPLVVLEDADMEEATNAAVTAAYACAGQWCTSTSRVIVVKKIASDFIERVVEATNRIIIGNGLDSNTCMGPVCGQQQMKSILEYIEIGKSQGAKLLCGGNRLKGSEYDKGCFVSPTVFTNVTPDMKIAREEIFGPVLSIITVADFDEALSVANAVDFGLSSSIYTTDLTKAFTFLERTEVGLTHVNLMTALKEPQLSFGGIKASGFGIPEAGETGIEFFTEHKVAYIKYR